jgi:hypothetical protein
MSKVKLFVITCILVATSIHQQATYGADSLMFERLGDHRLPTTSEPASNKGPLYKIEGAEFQKLSAKLAEIIKTAKLSNRWDEKSSTYSNLGPDAVFIRATLELDGKVYKIDSWAPMFRNSETAAVSETSGIVSAKSKTEKQEIEARNSESYNQIISIYKYLPDEKIQRK